MYRISSPKHWQIIILKCYFFSLLNISIFRQPPRSEHWNLSSSHPSLAYLLVVLSIFLPIALFESKSVLNVSVLYSHIFKPPLILIISFSYYQTIVHNNLIDTKPKYFTSRMACPFALHFRERPASPTSLNWTRKAFLLCGARTQWRGVGRMTP